MCDPLLGALTTLRIEKANQKPPRQQHFQASRIKTCTNQDFVCQERETLSSLSLSVAHSALLVLDLILGGLQTLQLKHLAGALCAPALCCPLFGPISNSLASGQYYDKLWQGVLIAHCFKLARSLRSPGFICISVRDANSSFNLSIHNAGLISCLASRLFA